MHYNFISKQNIHLWPRGSPEEWTSSYGKSKEENSDDSARSDATEENCSELFVLVPKRHHRLQTEEEPRKCTGGEIHFHQVLPHKQHRSEGCLGRLF